MLYVTDHAVERFIRHWHRGMPYVVARKYLEELVARSAGTKRRSRPRDAWLRIATTERGERICLVVRDRTVITVLPAGCYDAKKLGLVPSEQRAGKGTHEAVERARAQLAQRVETECARKKAEAILDAWRSGRAVKPKALRRAKATLGLS